jgi:hypothetical protein
LIISYTNNFVVVRAPKTGSTSLVFYFFKSGLVDSRADVYNIEGSFGTWKEFESHYKKHGWCTKIVHPNTGTRKNVHRTFAELQSTGAISFNMPCVGTVRNPLERLSSLYYYSNALRKLRNTNAETESINGFWDKTKERLKPQSTYFPDHAELFNTENLHEHVSKYILERGGKVDRRIEMRKNPDNKLDVFLAELTPNRKQDILDTYAKDFELWEKAYAVYN